MGHRSDFQRSFMQSKYASYWSSAVSDCRHDSRALWWKLGVLLRPPAPSSSIDNTADDFASFFVGKVSDIRSATSAAPPAVIVPHKTPSFSQFNPVATDEVMHLLTKVPFKTCQLDLFPTWLLKQLSDMLAPVSASLSNCSFEAGILPVSQKQAIVVVLPRLKNPTLDSTSLSSTGRSPISALSPNCWNNNNSNNNKSAQSNLGTGPRRGSCARRWLA